ncbi:MAG TPA: choice-of-anchor tandem repeat GloVer-containing protein [Terriglobia bacterium]|nr:choice-of-anchor tandem repeat GloVer-containing protein [Terriglobia bacterium]
MRKMSGRFSAVAGMTALMGLLLVAASVPAQAQTYRVLHSFTGGTDGSGPVGDLIRDTAGNLYGTTESGGNANCRSGCGTIFKLDIRGESVLYSFTGPYTDGEGPQAGLVRDAAGNLYGTTAAGGNSGLGTVFKVDATGKETVLYNFTGTPDGSDPVDGLVRDSVGNLYGTTYGGGDYVCQCGTVFKIDPTGKETVLYSFIGGTDGANPGAGLVHDASGKETVLYRFNGSADGGGPQASLIVDAAGDLYGTASYGGSTPSCGTVFKVDGSGTQTVLYSFTCGTDGGAPSNGLVMDPAGNLYGTASLYGDLSCRQLGSLCGTVFELSTAGTLSVLHIFTGGADGGWPLAGLVRDPVGNLYGTTLLGGALNNGVVFGIKP